METNIYKNKDDVYGRARVEDNEELKAYYSKLAELDTGALWTVANEIEPWEPISNSVPMLWKYDELRDLVLESARLVTPGQAGRRVVYLINKQRAHVKAACGWLYAGIQVTQPGESTPAHRHKAAALRFIMEGDKGYTIVNGNKISLGVNDFVITPNSTWHEHGVDAEGKTCIWMDGLDIPLVNALEANDYAVYDDEDGQEELVPMNYSPMSYSGSGLIPVDREWDNPYSPLFKYSWESTYNALKNAAQVTDGTPYDGVIMQYSNPLTGGHVMQTMGAAMQLLKPGQRTKAHKHTGSFIYQCAKGHGYTIIDGKRYDWKERDTFCVPSWAWHEHVNLSETEDAFLFNFNDLPTITKLGLYQEKAYMENDGHQNIS
ncbi:cupin domain-containing protein [Sphingobacterium lactis]|uniref:cupin domain-containing protein n=1 Tax=Sphingobacterium lactis TaxID=797291 RepID=UPI003EC772C0